MISLRFCLCMFLVTAVSLAAPGEPAPVKKGDPKLEALLRDLEKRIAKVRELEFKKPVVLRILERPAVGDKGLQGYYSPEEKVLVVYNDVAENYALGVLVHEMVHALQDQHFGLKNLHDPDLTGDEELARAALIEGDAMLTMIEVLKTDQPKIGASMEQPLGKAMNPKRAFVYGQGARYVAALKQKGGWKAVDGRYKFPPSTTAEILHPGERIGGVSLGEGKNRGEFGLAVWLKEQGADWPDAITAVAGWRADRFHASDRGKVTEVWMARPEQADALHNLFEKLARSKIEGGLPARAVQRRGTRLVWLEAKDEAGLARLREEAAGPLKLVVTTRQGKTLGFGQLIDRLAEVDFVCVGESHDNDPCHRVQLQIIQALFAVDPRLGVGLEMFQRPFQDHLDAHLAGKTSEDEMLGATEYRTRWGFEWGLYQPIARFCKANGVALAALNAPREITRRIREVGVDGLKPDEKATLDGIDFQVKAHRDHWYERLAAMHGTPDAPKEQKEKGYAIMTVWDGFMARSAVEFRKARDLRRMVILAGSGHVERGFGIPDRVAKLSGGKVATVQLVVGDAKAEEGVADFTIRIR